MHYYDFHIADYRKDTQHLSPIEHYIYRSLIDWYFLDESPITQNNPTVIRRLSLGSTNDAEALINGVFADFFELKDGFWHHRRIDSMLADYHARADVNRQNGKKGGRPPKKEAETPQIEPKETQSVNFANPTESESNPNQQPVTKNQQRLTNNEINTIPHQQAGAPATFELVVPDLPKAKKALDPDEQQGCREAWAGYAQAYQERYAVAPVRNAAVNAKVKQLVKRLGRDEAPGVCRFYVESVNDAFVVKKMHDMGLLLQGCEGYRTQWITGKAVTGESAKRVEKSQDQVDQMDEIRDLIKQHRGAAQ